MSTVLTGYESLTCLGDAEDTFAALVAGSTGRVPLRRDRAALGVDYAHHLADALEPTSVGPERVGAWVGRAVAAAAATAGLDATTCRVAVLVGTGLRELPAAERWWVDGAALTPPELHFAGAVRAALPGAGEVLTIANACSASGYALALAEDMLAAGEADAVVVAGGDSFTDSMLAAIGRGSAAPSPAVRPFDTDRAGVLLGEGAAAVVLETAESAAARGAEPLAVLRGVGLSCDAHHETAPAVSGVTASMRDAHARAGTEPAQVDLVVAHGTGTTLNDPTEAAALADVFGGAPVPVTALKGALGHTSGAAAVMSLIAAVQAMRAGTVPAVHGLLRPIPEADTLDLVTGDARPAAPRLAQVDAFGFGGVNAVALVEAAP